MNRFAYMVLVAVGPLLGAAMDAGLAGRMDLLGFTPKFALMIMAMGCLYTTRAQGAGLGFATGLAQGALAGANPAMYLGTRTVVGFLASWSRVWQLEPTPLMTALFTTAVTLIAEILLMLVAGPSDIGAYLWATIRVAPANGVLAGLLTLLAWRLTRRRGGLGLRSTRYEQR